LITTSVCHQITFGDRLISSNVWENAFVTFNVYSLALDIT